MSKDIRLCWHNCRYLTITEEQQSAKQKQTGHFDEHICKEYDKKVIHGGHHPELMRLKECRITEKESKRK